MLIIHKTKIWVFQHIYKLFYKLEKKTEVGFYSCFQQLIAASGERIGCFLLGLSPLLSGLWSVPVCTRAGLSSTLNRNRQICILKIVKAKKVGQRSWVLKCSLLQWCSWFVRGLLHRCSIKHCPWCWILSCLCGHTCQALVTIASTAFWNIGVLLPLSEFCNLVWYTLIQLQRGHTQSKDHRLFRGAWATTAEKKHSFYFIWRFLIEKNTSLAFLWQALKKGCHHYSLLHYLVLRRG